MVHLTGLASMLGAVNFIATIHNMRAPGMGWGRMPLFVWTILIYAYLIVIALSSLAATVTMLLLDRNFGTTFFDPTEGGSALLWQHLFWFFGHPEVYILVLPAFGIFSEVLPVFARKPIFGYKAIAASTAGIAFLGLLVWAHHMFSTPMSTVVLAFFMLSSFLIAVPTGVKIFNWVATLWRGTIEYRVALLYCVGGIGTFLMGGITGIFLAVFPVDWQLTDTYFVVAHFHYTAFGGAAFAMVAALYYWFPKMSGRMLSESLGKVSFWLFLIGFHLTFLIQHSAGLSGMPRRVYEYADENNLPIYNLISTIGSFILAVGVLLTVVNLVRSLKSGAVAGPDPWKAQHARVVHALAAAGEQLRRHPARPLGRADEGHPPPGRAGDGHGAALPGRAAGEALRWKRHASPRARTRWPLAGARQVLSDYVELTKPRVQSLLLLTTITTMYVAGDPSLGLVALTCLGGSLSAGGAGAVNHWFDRDIDAQMARTANRPVPAGRISPNAALTFGIVLAALSFLLLSTTVNVLSASLALCGFLGYVLVYTVWLKRTTPQNIVIGGAAGAVPPLVGWAAVTGHLDPTALYLFAIVFYWTPPHFWALSLLMKDEYERVGVPMMPVVHGEAETRRQILLYTCLLVVLTLLPVVFGFFGAIYAAVAIVLGGAFLFHAVRLQRSADRRAALRTYLFSLLYLALLFLAMVADTRL